MKKLIFILLMLFAWVGSAQVIGADLVNFTAKTEVQMNAITVGQGLKNGSTCYRSDTQTIFLYNGSAWVNTGNPLIDASGFSGNLDSGITNLQLLAQAVDTLTISGSGGGASQLSDLSDVNTSTPTNRNVLVADGTDWESRALLEADISDFGSYIETLADLGVTASATELNYTDGVTSNIQTQLDSKLGSGTNTVSVDTKIVNADGAGLVVTPGSNGTTNISGGLFGSSRTELIVGSNSIEALGYSISEINAVGNRSLITKEYGDANYSGGGLSNIVEDTSPQLGGTLDMNGQTVTGDIMPTTTLTYDLGNSSTRWEIGGFNNLYATTTTGTSFFMTTGNINNLLFVPTDTEPSSTKGRLYFDDSENTLKQYNGTAWEALNGSAGTDDQTAAEVSSSPTGNIAATNVDDAIAELEDEKLASISAGRTNEETYSNVIGQPYDDSVSDGAPPAGTLVLEFDVPPSFIETGTDLSMDDYRGYNTGVSAATSYNLVSAEQGGMTYAFVNAASEPSFTGTGITVIPAPDGAAFQANTDMLAIVWMLTDTTALQFWIALE